MVTDKTDQHVVGYGKLTIVWAGLLALTALTVWVSRIQLGIGHVWGSLTIATIKAGLVISFFMHMKYEGKLLRWLLFLAISVLSIFIGFTFFDVFYR